MTGGPESLIQDFSFPFGTELGKDYLCAIVSTILVPEEYMVHFVPKLEASCSISICSLSNGLDSKDVWNSVAATLALLSSEGPEGFKSTSIPWVF